MPKNSYHLTVDVTAGEVGMDSSAEDVAQDARLWGADTVIAHKGDEVQLLESEYDDLVDVPLGNGVRCYLSPDSVAEII